MNMQSETVTVCSNCLQASCWQGIFMCYESDKAGTVEKTREELKRLDLEHPSYWEPIQYEEKSVRKGK